MVRQRSPKFVGVAVTVAVKLVAGRNGGVLYEWCAGPGFIGFSLLGHGLCDSLCVADINPEAVAALRRTVATNGIGGQVSVYHSDKSMSSALLRSSDGAILTEAHSTANPVRVSIAPPGSNTYGSCHPYPNTSSTGWVHNVTCLADY